MSRRNEEPTQPVSGVSFRVPDFVGEDGVEYTDIEVIVEMDGDIRDTVNIAESLQRPMKAKDGDGREGGQHSFVKRSSNRDQSPGESAKLDYVRALGS